MNLSKYLESMKNLPDRFSNLAFWRGVRKLRDKLVETFEYVGEWGNRIENSLSEINTDLSGLKNWKTSVDNSLSSIDADLSGLKEWKTSVDSSLSTLQEWKTGVDSSLSSIDNDLSGLQTWKTSVDSSLSRIDSDLSGLKEWKTSVDSSLSTLQEWKTGVDSSLSSIDNDLSGLQTWKTSVDSSLSRIDSDLSGLKEWKTSVDSSLSALQEWKTGVDSSLSSIDNDLSGLQTWKTSVDSSLSRIDSDLSGLKEWKTSVDNSLSNIKNLLRNFNRSFGHDYFPRSTVELSSDEMKKISIVSLESSDSAGTFTTGYIKVDRGDLHIKEISGYDNTISLGRCGARLEVELSDHTHTMLPLGVYVENYKYWNDPREFTFKFHFYCNDSYDSYFPVNPRLSITYAKIIFDCDALQLSVAI